MESAFFIESPQKCIHSGLFPNDSPMFSHNNDFLKDPNMNFEYSPIKPAQNMSPNFRQALELLKDVHDQEGNSSFKCSHELSQISQLPSQPRHLEALSHNQELAIQIGSPKLSEKMQRILSPTNNLSESILTNTFKAIDESRIKLEDKDLQVELEIGGLKLHRLEKKIEECLLSSKSTLALNAQLSRSASRKVTPQMSPRKASLSPKNGIQIDIEDNSLKVKNENISLQSSAQKAKTEKRTFGDENSNHNQAQLPVSLSSKLKGSPSKNCAINIRKELGSGFKQLFSNNKENIQNSSGKKFKSFEEYLEACSSSSANCQKSNTNQESLKKEYNQKFEAYFWENKSGSSPLEVKHFVEANKLKKPKQGSNKLTDYTFNNNFTFHNSLQERDINIDYENSNVNVKSKEINRLSEGPHQSLLKQGISSNSKPKEFDFTQVLNDGLKKSQLPEEIILIDSDGKKKVYVLKLKQKLDIQKLETISMNPSMNENTIVTSKKQSNPFIQKDLNTLSQPSSLKNLDVVKIKDHLLNQRSMSGIFCQSEGQEVQDLIIGSRVHTEERTSFATKRESLVSKKHENESKDTEGSEFYFKQKIREFQNFLNEFEGILSDNQKGTSLNLDRFLLKDNRNDQINTRNTPEGIFYHDLEGQLDHNHSERVLEDNTLKSKRFEKNNTVNIQNNIKHNNNSKMNEDNFGLKVPKISILNCQSQNSLSQFLSDTDHRLSEADLRLIKKKSSLAKTNLDRENQDPSKISKFNRSHRVSVITPNQDSLSINLSKKNTKNLKSKNDLKSKDKAEKEIMIKTQIIDHSGSTVEDRHRNIKKSQIKLRENPQGHPKVEVFFLNKTPTRTNSIL